MAIHSRQELHAAIDALTPKDLEDGVFFDIPKKRRRAQAMSFKVFRVQLPPDLQRRFCACVNRYCELLGDKGMAWETICLLLEGPSDKLLTAFADSEGREIK